MNILSTHPFVVSYGFKNNRQAGFTFILPGKEIKIDGADDILSVLLAQCNGLRSLGTIVNSINTPLRYKTDEIEKLISKLLDCGVIVDAREHYLVFHKISANPMSYLHNVSQGDLIKMLQGESHLVKSAYASRTQLEKLFEVRASTRKFSGDMLSKEEFLRLAWAIYGKIKRSINFPNSNIGLGTVPSGGALYPLRLYGISMKISSFQRQGVYEFNSRGVSFLRLSNMKELAQIFGKNPPFNIEDIGGIFVLTCDFKQVAQKYSNRGYRLALLEAGHAAQNGYLWCAEQGLGIVEVGGFVDEDLARALMLSYPKQAPLTVLILGRKKHKT